MRSGGKGMGKAHNGPVASVAFMPDGRYLLSAGKGGIVICLFFSLRLLEVCTIK